MTVRWALVPGAFAHGTADRALLFGREQTLSIEGEHVGLVREALQQAARGSVTDASLAAALSLDDDDAAEILGVLVEGGLLAAAVSADGLPALPDADVSFSSVLNVRASAELDRLVFIAEVGGGFALARLRAGGACALCLKLRLLARAPDELATLARDLDAVASASAWAVAWTSAATLQRARAAFHAGTMEASIALVSPHDDGQTPGTPVTVLPHPLCPACAPGLRAEPLVVEDVVAVEQTGARAAAIDPGIGPFVLARSEAGGVDITTGGYALVAGRQRFNTGAFGAMGIGDDDALRRLVCLSECCERYALRTVRPDVEAVAYDALADRAVDPSRFTLFSKEQSARPGFPYRAFDPAAPLQWTQMTELSSGRGGLVPLEFVGNELDPERFPLRLFDTIGSTGAASHVSVARACLSALREILERDAAALMWLTRTPPPRLSLEGLPGALARKVTRAREAGLSVRAWSVPSDGGLPVVFVVATRERTLGSWPAGGVVSACAAGLEGATALEHALDELHMHHITLGLMPGDDKDWRRHPYDPDDVTQGFHHWWPLYLHYLNPDNAGAFSFLDAEMGCVTLDALPRIEGPGALACWRALLTQTTAAGLAVWGKEITPRDVALLGFHVVKLVVPGALDIACGKQSLRLGSPRLTERLRGRQVHPQPPPII